MPQTGQKKQVIGASVEKLLADKPFSAVSVEDICRNAGISRRTFYRYFTDKYEVITWIFEREYDQFRNPAVEDDVYNGIQQFCYVLYDNREFYRRALLIEGQNSFAEYCVKQVRGYIRQQYGMTAGCNMTETFLDHIAGAVFESMRTWLLQEGSVLPAVFVNRLAHVMEMLGAKAYFGSRHRRATA